MQTLVTLMTFLIFATAMFMQMLWMYFGKIGRDRYLRDIGNFRKPTSIWSRYYSWRVESLRNAMLDGGAFDFVLLVVLVDLMYFAVQPDEILSVILYVAFVLILSVASTVQAVQKVKGLKEREANITKQVEDATDKIAVAREMAIYLISAGPSADGRMWFALYRIGQRQDPVGWAIRDVLLDPELKAYQDGSLSAPPSNLDSSEGDGPGIN